MIESSLAPAAERELLELIHGVREQSLTAAQTARLEEMVLNSSAARRIYVKFVDMHAGLRWCAAAPPGCQVPASTDSTDTIPMAPEQALVMSQQPERQRQMDAAPAAPRGESTSLLGFLKSAPLVSASWLASPRALVIVVASGLVSYFVVLAISVLLTRVSWDANRSSPTPTVAADAPATATPRQAEQIGTLASDAYTRWQKNVPAADGAVAIGRSYELASGRAEIVLAGGTRVMIEGPARWQIASAKRLVFGAGKLSAHVPKRATGFTVATPTAEVIDLGTDFNVVVKDDSETQLVVTQGTVQVVVVDWGADPAIAKKPAPPIQVTTGQAMSIARGAAGPPVVQSIPFTAVWNDELAKLDEPLLGKHSPVIVHRITPAGAAGQLGFFGAVHGFDFVVMRPIRVTRLGAFDHLGDGIDPESSFTLQLFARDDHGTKHRGDDIGFEVLAEAMLTADAPGELKYGHRFATLEHPITLAPGAYSVVVYGWSPKNPLLQPSHVPGLRCEVATLNSAIFPLGWRGQKGCQPGTLPALPQTDDHAGVTLEFEEE